ncbi:hypothetical protein [Endozoicomonas lisbonensis]|uniref:hypothetical protein n=1 Tax=Endozoicomonas lisbonensis TaxID=3120522 RepID=UPI003393862A
MLSTSIMALVLALVLALTAMLFWRRQKRENQPQDVQPETSSQETISDTGPTGDLTMQNRVNRHVIPRDHHPVSRREISDNALKVLHRLTSNGYDAYLVGGCIRDIYFDLHPKDFDVATSATPEQVRRLFRNSRVIGRRFKLVHVLFAP